MARRDLKEDQCDCMAKMKVDVRVPEEAGTASDKKTLFPLTGSSPQRFLQRVNPRVLVPVPKHLW